MRKAIALIHAMLYIHALVRNQSNQLEREGTAKLDLTWRVLR